MKEKYRTPEMQITSIVWEDVITNSNETPFVPFDMTGVGEVSAIE